MKIEQQMRYLWALAVVGVVALALPLAAQDDPPGRVGRIHHMQGDVSLMLPGTMGWSEAPENYPLISGSRIYSGDFPSKAEIQSGGTEVRAWNNTDITLINLIDNYEQIALATGSIRVSIYSMNPGDTVEIDTPNGAVILQQPGSYRIDAFPGYGSSDLAVSNGLAVVAAPGGLNQEVGPEQAVQLFGSNPAYLEPSGFPPPDDLDNWSAMLDGAYRNSISARYVSPYMVGYGDLDANGTWAQEGEYGPVWYPNVGPGWRPYSAGHWAYVAPWGYTWIDDASWGYAPFHYGRWVVVGGRWGWVPGPREVRPVYSPALVAFVGGPHFSIGVSMGGGGGVAAWFPLGFGEPYVPWYHCTPHYAENVNVSNVDIRRIHDPDRARNFNTFVSNTRTVTNITQINVTNVTYVNRTQVVVVREEDMSSGRSVAQTQVKVTPDVQRQIASAPVHFDVSVAPPAHPLLAAKTSVKASVDRPTVLTPRGLAKATPEANPAKSAPAPLPKAQPAASLAAPKPGVVAGRPPAAVPSRAAATARPMANPATTPQTKPTLPVKPAEPAAMPAAKPAPPAVPVKPAANPAYTPAAKPVPPAKSATPAATPAIKPAPPTGEAKPKNSKGKPGEKPGEKPAVKPE